MKRLSLVTLVFLTLTGCTNLYSLSRLPRIEECDLDIPSSERVSGDLLRRLRIHVQAEGASEGLEIVVQKRGDRLTVIGLTRYGARAFTIEQTGTDLRVDSRMAPIETVPPINILHDIYVWPLGIIRSDRVLLEVADDGRSATVHNLRCHYRTVIFDVTDASSRY